MAIAVDGGLVGRQDTCFVLGASPRVDRPHLVTSLMVEPCCETCEPQYGPAHVVSDVNGSAEDTG
jgi:hypothetical protein